jgi:secretion/DNA translocation related TadE-like protein
MMVKVSEKGQTIVLIVVVIIGMVAMAALIVDGGNAYMNRRRAQTAADAGALAGAWEYCVNQNDPTAIITEYVENQNNATLVGWQPVGDEVEVTVSYEQSNFFARLFGQQTTTVRADARAGCYGIDYAGGLLPIAWTCRPPIPGMDTIGDDECAMLGIPHETMDDIIESGFDFSVNILDTGNPGDPTSYYDDLDGADEESKMIYLIADSLVVDGLLEDVCIELNPIGGTIDCDFENDGIIDIDGGAGRGWLLMDGDDNQGASILFKIVNGELEVATDTPRWFAGLSGGKASAFGVIRDVRVGDYALIPVFDAVCDTDDPVNDPVNCPVYYGSGEEVVYANGTADYVYYRVNGFAIFYISCVSKTFSDFCPGKQRAQDYLVINHNTSTVEGYFIEYFVPQNVGAGSGSLDLGIYILSLSE